MSPDKLNEIKKLLDIKLDIDEGIMKYESLTIKLKPFMNITLFLLFTMIGILVLGVKDILDLRLSISIFVGLMLIVTAIFVTFGNAGKMLDIYRAIYMLEHKQYDLDEIKELLQIENVKDYKKAKRKWKIVRNIYIIFGLLFGLFAVYAIAFNIIAYIGYFSVVGVILGVFALLINASLFVGFRYRQKIYSVGLILDEELTK